MIRTATVSIPGSTYCVMFCFTILKAVNGTTIGPVFFSLGISSAERYWKSPEILFCHLSGNPMVVVCVILVQSRIRRTWWAWVCLRTR